ncbi:MAG: AraC family transcriptional regulator [Maledivibacter sp.]|jgi:AraC-like DNA-binding protein|nr:AraC family transcriptional regulator [Maledivibacter sp.]
MEEKKSQTFSVCYNNNICNFEKYTFTPALSFELYNLHSEDGVGGKHKGINIFRIDFTKVGRFECEFSDHTFSYRGENEITVMSTLESEEWILESNYPVGVYIGCAIIIELDKLSDEDNFFLDKFNISIIELISIINLNKRWYKYVGSTQLIDLFNDIYNAHIVSNPDIIWLRILEILICISKNKFNDILTNKDSKYFSREQVNKVKSLHGIITKNYNKTISIEKIVRENGIGYSSFNTIFKNIYGQSPYQYLKKLRINLAANMLHETKSSILEIAVSVGYNNPSKFSNAFKSIFGVLPSTFRKQKNGMEH